MVPFALMRRTLAASRNNGFGFFKAHTYIKRDFNQATLSNVYKYIAGNKEKIKFERNESGFIRTTFPNWVFQPDERIAPLADGERLRANFWFYKSSDECGMGDESIHDHPNSFQSYIVNGGYEHEIYRITRKVPEGVTVFRPTLSLNIEQLWGKYQQFINNNTQAATDHLDSIPDQNASKKFVFSINKTNKSVRYEGSVMLRMTGTEITRKGDIVEIDPHMIHRVSKFHVVPGEKTLSLNIVRNQNKPVTNIYLPEQKNASIKVTRETVSAEDTAVAVEEMTGLFAKARM